MSVQSFKGGRHEPVSMTATILVPVATHAPWARDVADVVTDVEGGRAEAIVLHVFDPVELDTTRANLDTDGSLTLDELAGRKSGVAAAVRRLEDGGFDVDVRGASTDERAADAILEISETTDADRVYLYGRRRSPAGKAVFGSTVQRVVLNSAVPVTVVPPDEDGSHS